MAYELSQCDAKIKINHDTDQLDLNQTHWLNNDDKASLVCTILWIFMEDISSIRNFLIDFYYDLLQRASIVHGILNDCRCALMQLWESNQDLLENCTILFLAVGEFLHLKTLSFPILFIDFQFTHAHESKLYSVISMHRR